MAYQREPVNWEKVRQRLERLKDALESVLKELEKNELRVDALLHYVATLLQAVPLTSKGENVAFLVDPVPLPANNDTKVLKEKAKKGVESIEFDWQPSGGAIVRIDGGDPLELPPVLASLLKVISKDFGESDDHLVGWKSSAEVADMMKQRRKGSYTPGAINTSLGRLRDTLTDVGENRYLIQRRHKVGMRFALRHEPDVRTGEML